MSLSGPTEPQIDGIAMITAPDRLSVLYVEDDAVTAAIVRKRLQQAGYKIEIAGSGSDGLDKWESGSHHLILLDHGLPDMNGLEVIRKLARQGEIPPTIMVTAAGDETIAVRALKLGASDYIVKDVSLMFLELLPSVIEQAMAKHQLREENRAAKEALKQANARLEKRVADATRDLVSANENLKSEVAARKDAEERLREQNDFLKTVLESLTHPLCVIDVKDYSVRLANAAAGFSESSEPTKCYALNHGRSEPCRTTDPCPIEEVTRTRKAVTVEHVHVGKDGSKRIAEIHAYPILRADGSVGEVIEYSVDVTERREAESALRELLEVSSNIIQNIPSGLLICQFQAPDEFFLVNANLEAARLTGITAKEWRGQELDEIWPNSRQNGLFQACIRTMETGETFTSDAMVFRNRVSQRLFQVRAFSLPGALLGISFDDITDLRAPQS